MRRILWSVLLTLLLGGAARSSAAEPPSGGSQLSPDENNCAVCHGDPSLWRGKRQRLHIPLSQLDEDVHWKKGVNCHDCHGGDPGSTGIPEAHSTEAGYRDSLEDVWATCAACHEEQTSAVQTEGAHATAGEKDEDGRPTPLACDQCHGQVAHHLLPASDSRSPLFIENQIETCGSCHEDLSRRYLLSLHGQLTELGYAPAAKCFDCHGAHDILPISDPKSRLAPANRLQACRQCHPYAVQNFCDFDPHADHKDAEGYPRLHAVYLGMEILLYSVFGFFGLHTFFWLVRSLIHTLVRGRPKRLVPGRNAYVRFELIHRLLHLIVIISFLGLALTGLPLRYSDQAWGKTLANALGGFSSTSVWHRVLAVATFFYVAAHLVWLARKTVRLRSDNMGWRDILLGPDSPVPVWRDFQDLWRMASWFSGFGPKPVFERWTYWEKFDYWAVFWGVGVIGASGLLLWFPNFFCRFFSGEILNAAKVVHSEEALLAVGFIFAVHFFHNAIRPEIAPLDLSMFTGLTSEPELQEERPEYMQRLRRDDKLDRIRVTAPSTTVLWLATLAGFAALALGFSLLAAIIAAALGG